MLSALAVALGVTLALPTIGPNGGDAPVASAQAGWLDPIIRPLFDHATPVAHPTATPAHGAGPVADTTPASSLACDLGPPTIPWECSSSGCGGNGIMNGFPIGAIHRAGCRNHDGARLVSGSLRRGAGDCPEGPLDLDASGNRLVGRDPTTGAIVCRGDALVGATFTVETLDLNGAVHTADIRIAQRGTLRGWRRVNGRRPTHPTYVFTAASGPQVSLCEPGASAAWSTAWLRGAAPPTATTWRAPARRLVQVTDGSFDHHALIVTGETYSRFGQIDPKTTDNGWFTIACATGAIGKMRLLGYDPAAGPSQAEARQATLKMLIGQYCVIDAQFTVPGTPIRWQSLQGLSLSDLPAAARTGPVEAYWGSKGALCIDHSRMWRQWHPLPTAVTTSERDFVDHVRNRCGLGACSAAHGHDAIWKTSVLDHIDN